MPSPITPTNTRTPPTARSGSACDGDALRWQGLGLDLPMVHRHYDVFEIVPEPMVWFENRTVQFATGVEGHIESLAVPLEPAVAPIVFRRLPSPQMLLLLDGSQARIHMLFSNC